MKVLLISGKAGHGKDTLAQLLKDKLELRGEKVLCPHFADLVKFYAKQYLGWNGEKDIAGRQMLQDIGNNSFRQFDPDYWARITAELIKIMGDYFGFTYAIVADTRYPNEIDVMKDYNSDVITIRIIRSDGPREWNNPNLTDEQKQNEGEIALDHYAFDYVVENCFGLEILSDTADNLIEDLTSN